MASAVSSKELTPEAAKAISAVGALAIRGPGNTFTIFAEVKAASPEKIADLVKKLREGGYIPNEIVVTFGDQPSLLRQENSCGCGGDCGCEVGGSCGCSR